MVTDLRLTAASSMAIPITIVEELFIFDNYFDFDENTNTNNVEQQPTTTTNMKRRRSSRTPIPMATSSNPPPMKRRRLSLAFRTIIEANATTGHEIDWIVNDLNGDDKFKHEDDDDDVNEDDTNWQDTLSRISQENVDDDPQQEHKYDDDDDDNTEPSDDDEDDTSSSFLFHNDQYYNYKLSQPKAPYNSNIRAGLLHLTCANLETAKTRELLFHHGVIR